MSHTYMCVNETEASGRVRPQGVEVEKVHDLSAWDQQFRAAESPRWRGWRKVLGDF